VVGVALVSGAVGQPQRSVDRAVRELHRPPTIQRSRSDDEDTLESFGRRMAAVLGIDCSDRWRQPLRLVRRSPERHVAMLALAAIGGALAPPVMLVVLRTIGGAGTLPFAAPLAFSVLGALLAPLTIHRSMIDEADTVRRDLRHQLSAYLDMVSMLLAGNTGHEGALDQAARAGDGLLFVELRRRMRDVKATGRSLVGALAAVAEDLDIPELDNVAAATALSAAEGAPVARTLAAKCATLRSTLASDDEAAARVQTDKVTPPLVGMAVLFMALVIYPALFST